VTTSPSPQTDTRVQQLLALHRAAIAITGELNVDRLLQRIVDVARELVGCRYAALGVLGSDGYIARFPTSGVSTEERERIGAPPRGHGLLGVMLRAGETLRIPEIGADPRSVGFPPNHPPMKSLLGVPIFVRGRLMGDLYLTEKIGAAEFSAEDEWLVQLLATHAATALTNAELHEENMRALRRVEEERSRSEALLRVNQAISSSVQLEEVIHLILNSGIRLLDACAGALYLVSGAGEPGGPRVSAQYGVGLDESWGRRVSDLPLDRTVVGRVILTGAAQVVPDAQQEEHTAFPRLENNGALRALASVPLWGGAALVGVLTAYFDRPHAVAPEGVQLLEAFAAQAATAMFNARLYEEAQRGRAAAETEQQRLREVEQMKDEFLSTAAHELRTPLTTIRMSAGLAHEQLQLVATGAAALSPRLVDLVGLVLEGSERMQSLVNDLLDLTRLEQGRSALSFDEVDMRDVTTASAEATQPLFASKDQRLALHVPEGRFLVRGDSARLEQVVINLLSNAHKYSPAGTLVELRVTRSGGECLMSVRDQGPGVPEEERERIFERFYRSTQHRQDRTPSTGLGLPIARTIAELHRGRVWVAPAPGGGSIFTLALPLAN
jgi:signal transduction histidine kinase